MPRTPITTLGQLAALEHDEMLAGYHDGLAGVPEPGGNRSDAYWHGWRNGRVDGGHDPKDAAQAALAKEWVRAQGEGGG